MSTWETHYLREESTFSNKDNGKTYYQSFRPKTEPVQKTIVVHHGFGEHGGRYTNLIESLAGKGVAFYLLDARGHGKTDGRRGVVSSYTDFLADLKELIGIAKTKENSKKVILLGHSMGAVMSLLYAGTDNNQADLQGLVLSGLAIKVKTDFVMDIKKGIGGLLANVLPTLTIPAGLNVNLLSHDEQVVEAYVKDPLVHGNICAYLGDFLLNCYTFALECASKIQVPVYLFHGREDQIALCAGSEDAFAKIPAKDKSLKIFDGLYHETMNELAKDKKLVFAELVSWIEKH